MSVELRIKTSGPRQIAEITGGRLELYAIVILLTPSYWTQGR